MRCTNCFSTLPQYSETCSYCGSQELVALRVEVRSNSDERQRLDEMFGASVGSRDLGPFHRNNETMRPYTSGRDVPRSMRFLSFLVDFIIAGLTLGVGWFVWFVIVLRNGQTPAKTLFKTRLVHESGAIPSSSVTFWRYYIPNLLSWVLAPFGILGLLSLPAALALIFGFLQFLSWLIPLIDSLLIFLPPRKRGVDYLFKTKVVYL